MYRIDNKNNIIWQSICTYVLHDSGEILTKDKVKTGEYKIIYKEQHTEIIYKKNKQYGYTKKTFYCQKTNQGRQTSIEF